MTMRDLRFECRPEPSGRWTVWDCKTQRPAELGGCQLSGRKEELARAACGILTRIYSSRLDAGSIRDLYCNRTGG